MASINMKLVGLPVFTDEGDKVGKINKVELDDNGQVKVYCVRQENFGGFFKRKLIIHPSAVISIDKEKMVVKGTEIKLKEPKVLIKEALASN